MSERMGDGGEGRRVPDDLPPLALLDTARAAQHRARLAEVDLLEAAYQWAVQHPAHDIEVDAASFFDNGGEYPIVGYGVPSITETAAAEFGVALAITSTQAKRLIGHSLELHHRLPRVWEQLQNGSADAFRARTVAEVTIHAFGENNSRAALAWLDRRLAPLLHKITRAQVRRIVDEALLRFNLPTGDDDNELPLHVTLVSRTPSPAGTGVVHSELNHVDALDLDHTLNCMAAELKAQGSTDTLDVRRAIALGLLARHQTAQSLASTTGDRTLPAARRLDLNLHLTVEQFTATGLTIDPIARLGRPQTTLATEWITRWAHDTFTEVRILPMLDLNQPRNSPSYTPGQLLRRQIQLRDGTCIFPFCDRPAERCDLDHIEPFDPEKPASSQTRDTNLACECRRHHRLKTFDGWKYQQLTPSTHLWTSPLGIHLLRTPTGTIQLT